MRLVFAGTPEPAVVALRRLIESEHEVLAVLTRPDAQRGRGRSLRPSPVKACAEEHGIEVLTPRSLKPGTEDGEQLRERLRELAPDCLPVVAYGQLITPDLLDVAPHGWVNLHFSLLPAWRGAAPVQAAIAHGDDITGASTFRIEEGLDTGPVFGTVTEPIGPKDTADDLLTRLAYSGADLLAATMDGLDAGTLEAQPQRGEATYAAKIAVEDARIDWNAPDFDIDRKIRAHTPGPGAWTMLGESRLKIAPVSREDAVPESLGELRPGQIGLTKKDVFVGTATRPVRLSEVQAPGKRRMGARDWARGLHTDEELWLS
ncbi:methionyl-tRNA formyltransferase [Corynebacterium uropygiale]|uniref:Methionyl-tRNA formyltransferase n=1 Tax=Corynebacterium uropygiale TaxID=1775911 RepID=A0A9X1TXV8_9CORY|nr:methionyl-tRNA formyltransferase [Corynebacterium uropygiale]MCF4006575.1 methionyl-tRNA formyltransferase [Corynebacterium uropygiale]